MLINCVRDMLIKNGTLYHMPIWQIISIVGPWLQCSSGAYKWWGAPESNKMQNGFRFKKRVLVIARDRWVIAHLTEVDVAIIHVCVRTLTLDIFLLYTFSPPQATPGALLNLLLLRFNNCLNLSKGIRTLWRIRGGWRWNNRGYAKHRVNVRDRLVRNVPQLQLLLIIAPWLPWSMLLKC